MNLDEFYRGAEDFDLLQNVGYAGPVVFTEKFLKEFLGHCYVAATCHTQAGQAWFGDFGGTLSTLDENQERVMAISEESLVHQVMASFFKIRQAEEQGAEPKDLPAKVYRAPAPVVDSVTKREKSYDFIVRTNASIAELVKNAVDEAHKYTDKGADVFKTVPNRVIKTFPNRVMLLTVPENQALMNDFQSQALLEVDDSDRERATSIYLEQKARIIKDHAHSLVPRQFIAGVYAFFADEARVIMPIVTEQHALAFSLSLQDYGLSFTGANIKYLGMRDANGKIRLFEGSLFN